MICNYVVNSILFYVFLLTKRDEKKYNCEISNKYSKIYWRL